MMSLHGTTVDGRGHIASTRLMKCSHWRTLRWSLPALGGTAEKIQTRATDADRSVQLYNGNNGKEATCPQRIDCYVCTCISCDYRACLLSGKANRNHYLETGHQLGYCRKYLSYHQAVVCFKCGAFVDELIELGADRVKFPLEMTRKFRDGSTSFKKMLPWNVESTLSSSMHAIVYCRGLFNFSKTCYINCIIQVLVHTPLFSDFFTENHQRLSTQNEQSGSGQGLISIVQSLLKEFQKREACAICPTDLLTFIWEKMPHVGSNKQHDAHEFFISVINMLHQEFILPNEGVLSAEAESLIDQLFLGRLQSEVICNVCGHSRYTDDPFLDAALEVISEKPRGTPVELCDLLNRFTRLEHLDDSNLLHCPCCAKKTKSTKQLKFKVLPRVICIQLKRFRLNARNSSGSGFTKIKTKVRVPESLDFSPYKSNRPSQSAAKRRRLSLLESSVKRADDCYQLYAIVNHTGSYASGHYKSYIRKRSYWVIFDDQTVKRVSREQALASEGYLLFYKKSQPQSILE